jgi:lipopolysaccharide/colanic/teichoic acid biosynthesis glycosyltransferase
MPGLTCIWQVSGRSKLDLDQRLKLDLEYVEGQSFWLDLVLLWKTIGAVIRAEGAY